MKSKFFYFGALTLLFAACQDELQQPVDQASGGGTPLCVNVLANPTTKALVEGNTMPAGQIGVKMVDNTGTTYDSQTYNNIFYKTTDGNTWTVDPANNILLSATEGKAYAYYPYQENASLDFTAIPISSAANPDDQIDYMYGDEATGLKNSNPSATFTMSHAMSIVNFTIAKGTYTGAGAITSVKMKGNTASNTGTMHAVEGSVTATNKGYEFESTASLTLGNSSVGKFIVVPSGESSSLDFKVVMDGETYTASTDPVVLESGKVYKYTLTMNYTAMTVSTVTATPWADPQAIGRSDAEPMYFADKMKDAFQAINTDGVYAVKDDGTPVAYAEASDDTYAAVALVLNGRAYQVAKTDVMDFSNSTYYIYYCRDNPQHIEGLTKYRMADDTYSWGYLPMADGSWHSSSNNLNGDWTQWSTYNTAKAVLSDFNGKENTELIISAQTIDGVIQDYTIAKAIEEFRSNTTVNEDQRDWFCPACGELAFMFLKKTELNDLLSKVSGFAITNGEYLSSSEWDANYQYTVDFEQGEVDWAYKGSSYRVRLLREI